ncbi:hypothetical protein LMG29739_02915 [Paraburkholderia solisilvae]|uniref:DUF2134 domain-containing protein n=2 Tax=Paraburkholderia solisilvae TaxID=624376 RepID=A0A6J5DWE3_9BURK|nr:hypothetical protein LMG29739_02915 [Paraburkholderia solisilvae]
MQRARAHRVQRGAIAVTAALWLAVAVAALGALDVGNVFLARRQLQRTADMAASAGAQSIGGAPGCGGATDAAKANATGNGLQPDATITVTCGRWDAPAAGAPVFDEDGTPLNAVQVDVARQIPYLFLGPSRTVHASATAKAVNIGTFAVATSTATLSGGVLNGLLNSLLGTNLSLGVLTFQNLASTRIKLGDLATALNAGSIDQLLKMNVSVADLAHAMVSALDASGTASADVTSALATIAATVPAGLKLNLGNSGSGNGLFALGLTDPQGALSAQVSALDMLMAAAQIANGTSAIDVSPVLNLGALANVSARLVVTQPPVIAVGEAGVDANGVARTSAHAAQVRLYVNLRIGNFNVLGLVSAGVLNLPLYIEVGDATASLQSTQCTGARQTSISKIGVQWGAAAVCVSNAAVLNPSNTTQPVNCSQPASVASLSVLGYPLLGVGLGNPSPPAGVQVALRASSPAGATPPTLNFNAQPGDADDYQSVNTNALGSASAGLLGQVITQLPNALYLSVGGVNVRLGNLGIYVALAPILNGAVDALKPALSQLDTLLVPLLQALGVQVGLATVHDIALSCGEAQLVN